MKNSAGIDEGEVSRRAIIGYDSTANDEDEVTLKLYVPL
jgi:hypothetical protein